MKSRERCQLLVWYFLEKTQNLQLEIHLSVTRAKLKAFNIPA